MPLDHTQVDPRLKAWAADAIFTVMNSPDDWNGDTFETISMIFTQAGYEWDKTDAA